MANPPKQSNSKQGTELKEPFSNNALWLSNGINSQAIDYPEAIHAFLELAIQAKSLNEYKVCDMIDNALRKKLERTLDDPHAEVSNALGSGKSIKIFFVNDNGAYAGAGIATARQAKAFSLNKHTPTLIALNSDSNEVSKGIKALNQESEKDKRYTNLVAMLAPLECEEDSFGRADYSKYLATAIPEGSPVVIGNLHSSKISLKFIFGLIQRRCPIFIYSHDLDFITGGCAYPQYYSCDKYKSECTDHECQKPPEDYPCSSNGLISIQAIERRILSNNPYVKLFANSRWTESFLRKKYPQSRIARSTLGIDTSVFRQNSFKRLNLRNKLGIPLDSFVVAIGADSLSRKGKGGETVNWLVTELSDYSEIKFLSFGHVENDSTNIFKAGYDSNETSVAEIFQSSDLFVNPATIEAFGQTAIESAACGCPVLGLKGTGLDDAIHQCRNGYLCDSKYELKALILALFNDKVTLFALQEESTMLVANTFSLNHLYWNWVKACVSTPLA